MDAYYICKLSSFFNSSELKPQQIIGMIKLKLGRFSNIHYKSCTKEFIPNIYPYFLLKFTQLSDTLKENKTPLQLFVSLFKGPLDLPRFTCKL